MRGYATKPLTTGYALCVHARVSVGVNVMHVTLITQKNEKERTGASYAALSYSCKQKGTTPQRNYLHKAEWTERSVPRMSVPRMSMNRMVYV